ncbi:MAG: hypothetical protein Q8Q14_00630 [Gemmatimonadales bacterium]|nr:hypothetical protein [Gemmatimonadales bacterium]
MTTPGPALVELCCGTASVSLWALARARPLTGFMGSKRRDASVLVSLLGVRDPARVVLVDAGPWGDVWKTLRDADIRRETVEVLRAWHARGDLVEVWPTLLHEPPSGPAWRAAQYLCLQARMTGCMPLWWSTERARWEANGGGRVWDSVGEVTPTRSPVRRHAVKRIATLADRVEALDHLDWSRVEVVHGDVRDVDPVPGSVVYIDPPYLGAPRYAELLPRADVLDLAQRHADVADLVVVSEAEPLPLEGWTACRLRDAGKPEWLTMSRAPRRLPAVQIELALEVAS